MILSIDTSCDVCSVALHHEGKLITARQSEKEKSHSSLLPKIILDACSELKFPFGELSAVAVSEGPGSYTGLRIGVSTAKGIAYALKIPLLAIATLDIHLEAVKQRYSEKETHYLCPMLDARRMEVYTKMVNEDGLEIWEAQAKILDVDSFSKIKEKTYLFGNGMPKFRAICEQKNLFFIDNIYPHASYMGAIAWKKYQLKQIEDVAYFEPNYLKEWQANAPKKK